MTDGELIAGAIAGAAALAGFVGRARRTEKPRTRKPRAGGPITRSTVDDTGTVRETPEQLLAQARQLDPSLSLDEYAAARLVASEHAGGSPAEMAAIIDSALNWAERRSLGLYESLTRKANGTFGKQGRRRRAATRRDPRPVHLQAALAVLRRGELRGISRQADRFFDPRTQLALARAGRTCGPLTILERWSFDYPWKHRDRRGRRRGCELDRRQPGRSPRAWVGDIDGIDPLELMLFRPHPVGDAHRRAYERARQLIETLGPKESLV